MKQNETCGALGSNLDRTSGKTVVMATAPQVPFCFFRDAPSLKTNASIFLEIFLIQYFNILVAQFTTSSLS